MKKILALLLAVVMIASLFVGCNTSTTSPTNPSEPSNETPTDQAETPTDETPAPTENNGDVVTVKWVAVGNGMPANYDAWKANLDKYLEEKIGVHLEMEIVSWSDWDNRRNVMVNANDDYDIMFTNLNTYQNDIRIGAFLDITDMVPIRCSLPVQHSAHRAVGRRPRWRPDLWRSHLERQLCDPVLCLGQGGC